MNTIKLTLELTPEQLSKIMLDIRTGADVPASRGSVGSGYYEEKLAEAEEIIRQKDKRIAGIEKLLQTDDTHTRTIQTYRLRLHDAEQELDHLRNVCAEHECALRAPIDNVLGVFDGMANQGPLTDWEYIRRELGEIEAQCRRLLITAQRDGPAS